MKEVNGWGKGMVFEIGLSLYKCFYDDSFIYFIDMLLMNIVWILYLY